MAGALEDTVDRVVTALRENLNTVSSAHVAALNSAYTTDQLLSDTVAVTHRTARALWGGFDVYGDVRLFAPALQVTSLVTRFDVGFEPEPNLAFEDPPMGPAALQYANDNIVVVVGQPRTVEVRLDVQAASVAGVYLSRIVDNRGWLVATFRLELL